MGTLQLTVAELFTEHRSLIWPYLCRREMPWDILPDLKALILDIGNTLDPTLYHHPAKGIWIAKTAKIAPTASITAPVIIGERTEVRHCAFIRGSALVGNDCVVGNSTELKNCVLFDGVQVPHFNYIGDSILGYKAHMGAGAVTSNVKADRSPVLVKKGDQIIETGLRKLGAILGDFAEIGCNAVLNPGTVVGQRTSVYPTASVRGVIPSDAILKAGKDTEIVPRNA